MRERADLIGSGSQVGGRLKLFGLVSPCLLEKSFRSVVDGVRGRKGVIDLPV